MCLISQPLWMGLLYYWGLFSILFLLIAALCRTLFHYQIFSMIWWQHEGSIMHYCSFFFDFLSMHGTWILCSARFRPRILIDVTSVDLSTTVLGFKISMPIMVAPTAMQRMAHPEGMSIITYLLLTFSHKQAARASILCGSCISNTHKLFIRWISLNTFYLADFRWIGYCKSSGCCWDNHGNITMLNLDFYHNLLTSS